MTETQAMFCVAGMVGFIWGMLFGAWLTKRESKPQKPSLADELTPVASRLRAFEKFHGNAFPSSWNGSINIGGDQYLIGIATKKDGRKLVVSDVIPATRMSTGKVEE